MSKFFGGENIRNEILRELRETKTTFQHITHKETNPEKIAKELGINVNQGIKCLIIRGKKSKKNYLVCVRGHQRVDLNALEGIFGEACELEKPDVIKERYGLDVGGVPPFGKLLGLDVYFDDDILNCQHIICSCGPLKESLRMHLIDLVYFARPIFAKLA